MTKVVYYYSECTGEMVYAIEYYQSGVAILRKMSSTKQGDKLVKRYPNCEEVSSERAGVIGWKLHNRKTLTHDYGITPRRHDGNDESACKEDAI